MRISPGPVTLKNRPLVWMKIKVSSTVERYFVTVWGKSFIGEGFMKAQVLFDVEEGEGEVRLVPLAVEMILFDLFFEEVHPYQR
jgi:hypothetical protein